MMVQRLEERRPRLVNTFIVHDLAQYRVRLAGDEDVNVEAMAMKSAAFVVVGQERQLMRCLDLELSFKCKWHGFDYYTPHPCMQPHQNMAP